MVATLVIIAVLAVVIFIAANSSKEHFQEGCGCCGGGGGCGSGISESKAKAMMSSKVDQKKRIEIEGMSCSHCSNAVEKAINSINGASAKVNLDKKEAIVSLRKIVTDEALRRVVQEAGYSVVSITDL